MVKKRILAIVLIFALCFGGCTFEMGAQNVEELLVAPKIDPGVAEVVLALEEALGTEIQLKHPSSGALGPLLLEDLTGDGVREAVIFYTLPSVNSNVHVAVLQAKSGGGYSFLCEGEGVGTSVEQVYTARVLQSSANCLIVSYSNNFSEKYLAVYKLENGDDGAHLNFLYGQTHLEFAICRMRQNTYDELLIASANAGVVELRLVAQQGGEVVPVSTLELESNCQSLLSGKVNGKTVAVADHFDGGNRSSAAVFWQDDALQRYETIEGERFSERTLRPSVLLSADIDGDGAVEVPYMLSQFEGAREPSRFLQLLWYRPGDASETYSHYGVADIRYNYFITLPALLRDGLFIQQAEGADGWTLVDSQTLLPVLELVVLPVGERLEEGEDTYTQVGALSGYRFLMREGTQLPQGVETGSLLQGFIALY